MTLEWGSTSKGVCQMGSETQPDVLEVGKANSLSVSQRKLSGSRQPQGQEKSVLESLELQLCSRSQGIFPAAISLENFEGTIKK